jgi:hypothetical protein
MGLYVLSRLRETFATEIRTVDLFEAPTVGALAQLIDAGNGRGAEEDDGARRAEIRRDLRARRRDVAAIAILS